MAIRFKVNFREALATADILANANPKFIRALLDRMNVMMVALQNKIIGEYLSAQGPLTLGVRTGALQRSIQAQKSELDGSQIVGKVAWGGGEAEKYAYVHEYGGENIYVIYPVNAKVLAWKAEGDVTKLSRVKQKELFTTTYGGGKSAITRTARPIWKGWIFRAYVFHPPALKRSFVKPALTEMQPAIVRGLRDATLEFFDFRERDV